MLRPIGHVTSADASCVLPRIGAPPSGRWARLANKVSAQLQQQYASKLFAIALRGSTARGTAVAGVSDLDLIVLLNHSATDIPSGGLLSGHRVKVDLAQSTYPDFMTQPKWAWMRISLAFSGSVISGPDFISTLPDPTLKPHCIAHLKACDRWIAAWNRCLRPPRNPSRRRRSANG
ncbi:nucleotidyltransferase domain-containing protein [Paracoccaceae bacterium]|nr:nucleotidyltransferase domain-containing protein [Paracoccaceae bacterium]